MALASSRSQGDRIPFGDTDRELKVQTLENHDFAGFDMALFAAGSEAAKVHAPRAAKAGCVVIDNSSLYRMDPDVPLIVPEVNPDAIAGYAKRNIIANPNCSTAQLVVALKPLHDRARIKRVVVATYQSVSGAGKAGMDELFEQTRAIFVNDEKTEKTFTKQIAFNVIPHIDQFLDDGSTREEWKMVVETKKILDPKIKVSQRHVRRVLPLRRLLQRADGHARHAHPPDRLAAAFAVTKPGHLDGVGTVSVQFYDPDGHSAFKVFLSFGGRPPSADRQAAFDALRDHFRLDPAGGA